MLICRYALLAGLVVTPCFADDPEKKSNSVLEVVSASEKPPAVASEEANKKANDESDSALSKTVEELESRIAELERIVDRGKLRRRAERSKATASNRQSGHPEPGTSTKDVRERELRIYQLKTDANQVVQTIRALLVDSADNGLLVESDKRTNSVVAWGAKAQLSAVGTILQALDAQAERSVEMPDKGAEPKTLAEQVIGTWVLADAKYPGTPSGIGIRLKVHTPTHWVVTQPDPETGEVLIHLGGRYSLDGNTVNGTTDFAVPRLKAQIGQTGKTKFEFDGETLKQTDMEGNWLETWTRWKPTERFPVPE